MQHDEKKVVEGCSCDTAVLVARYFDISLNTVMFFIMLAIERYERGYGGSGRGVVHSSSFDSRNKRRIY